MMRKPQQNPFAPPAKEAEVVPDIREVIASVADRNKLAKLIEQQAEWGKVESEAKKTRKPLTEAIKKLVGAYEVTKMMCNGYRVSYFDSPRTSISEDALLAAGVSPTIINKCKVTSHAYTLRITQPGEEDGE